MEKKRFLGVIRGQVLLTFLFIGLGTVVWAQEKEWKEGYYPDGKLRYKGYFVNGQPVGEILRYDPEGRLQARMDHQGERVKAFLYSKEGDFVASGDFVSRKRQGEWVYKQKELLLAKEYYRDGKLDGLAITYFPSGKIREQKCWQQGVLSGEWKQFYSDGQLRFRALWVAGKLNGEVEAYSPEGELVTRGKYRNGLRDGEWEYYRQERLERKRNYKNGVLEEREQEDLEENAALEEWLKEGEKIVDPADFTDQPEVYLKITGN